MKEKIDTIETYNEIAGIYFKRWDRYTDDLLKSYKKLKSLAPSGLVLDVGCGTGRDGTYMKSMGYGVIGIDRADKMLEIAKNRIDVIKADFDYLPFKDETIDIVWSNTSLTHSKNKIGTLNEWKRTLKKDGIAYTCVQNKFFIKYIARQIQTMVKKKEMKLGFADYDGRKWYYESLSDMKKIFNDINLDILWNNNFFKRWVMLYGRKSK